MTIRPHYDEGVSLNETLSHHRALAGGLRHLLVLLLAKIHTHVVNVGVNSAKFHRMVKTAARLTRQLVKTQLYIYRAQIKSNMLSNPHWRGRVIVQLGGYHNFARWTRRFVFAQQRQNKDASKLHVQGQPQPMNSPPLRHQGAISRRPKGHDDKRHDDKGHDYKASHHLKSHRNNDRIQFRLPPLPRIFHSRVKASIKGRSHRLDRRSPLDAPIIITPAELMPEAFGPTGAKPHPTHTPTPLSRDEIVAMIAALPSPETPPQPP